MKGSSKNSYERRAYESVDDRAYLRLYLNTSIKKGYRH